MQRQRETDTLGTAKGDPAAAGAAKKGLGANSEGPATQRALLAGQRAKPPRPLALHAAAQRACLSRRHAPLSPGARRSSPTGMSRAMSRMRGTTPTVETVTWRRLSPKSRGSVIMLTAVRTAS